MEQTPPLTVAGCILSEDGRAIPEVKVAYLQRETFTDDEGCFSLEDVPPGPPQPFKKEIVASEYEAKILEDLEYTSQRLEFVSTVVLALR
ncbi:MAG: hypothetical protein AYK18_14235 [Theionarchaea archaeon DG-70]|nr:MAG: hypothetical protein AYK18_14235 [Theionarchaea archaeon DG-70]